MCQKVREKVLAAILAARMAQEEEDENNRDNLSFASTPATVVTLNTKAHKNNLPSLSRPPHVIKTEYIISSPLDFPSNHNASHVIFNVTMLLTLAVFFLFLSLSSVQLSSCAFFYLLCFYNFPILLFREALFSYFKCSSAVNEISPWKWNQKRLCKIVQQLS